MSLISKTHRVKTTQNFCLFSQFPIIFDQSHFYNSVDFEDEYPNSAKREKLRRDHLHETSHWSLKVTANKVPHRKYRYTENGIWLHSDYSQSLGILRSAEPSIPMWAGHLGVSDSIILRRNGIAGLPSMVWDTESEDKSQKLECSIGWALNKDHLVWEGDIEMFTSLSYCFHKKRMLNYLKGTHEVFSTLSYRIISRKK